VPVAIAIAIDIHNFIVPSATPTVELAATARNSNYSYDPLAFSITRFSPEVPTLVIKVRHCSKRPPRATFSKAGFGHEFEFPGR
jgi:hypothetical protein